MSAVPAACESWPCVPPCCRYCPQFDALYDLLTVREHLELFARIKGIEEAEMESTVMSLIKLMDLTKFENKRAGTLSGGNKRKLSVAIALIGEPPVVFLGEWCREFMLIGMTPTMCLLLRVAVRVAEQTNPPLAW